MEGAAAEGGGGGGASAEELAAAQASQLRTAQSETEAQTEALRKREE